MRDDRLRQPVFLGIREDKSPTDVVREKASERFELKALQPPPAGKQGVRVFVMMAEACESSDVREGSLLRTSRKCKALEMLG
jgi:hypothetical protein